MATARRSPLMNVMVEAAEKAARGLVRDFGEVENLQVSKKGPSDFVSNADHKAEKTIMEVLNKARPSFDLLMEESGLVKHTDRKNRWIIDPLDGTNNFLHGLPHWAIVIAMEKDGEVVAGLVYEPLRDEMFTAEKGCGAFVNNKRLRVSTRTDLGASIVAVGAVPLGSRELGGHMEEIGTVMNNIGGTRRSGSAALDLAYVAAGRYEGFWERGLNPWDVAAGSLIVKEAGGRVTDLAGGKDFVYGQNILVSNGVLHDKLLKMLNTHDPKAQKVAT